MLSGKVAVITGAGRGIGRAVAVGFAEAGAAVVCAARGEVEISEVAAQVEEVGGRALALVTDVSDYASIEAMYERTHEVFGGVDIVVANAGISSGKTSVEASRPLAWARVLEVNLLGTYYTLKAAIPYLKERGSGKLITVGSGLGHRGRAERSEYAVSKAGGWMLTRVLAQELVPFNISVNELVPGPVDTAMNPDGQFAPEGEWYKRPEEVVPLALFLASQPEVGPTAQSFSLMRRDT